MTSYVDMLPPTLSKPLGRLRIIVTRDGFEPSISDLCASDELPLLHLIILHKSLRNSYFPIKALIFNHTVNQR